MLIINDETSSHLYDPPAGFQRGLELGLRGPSDHEYGDIATAYTSDFDIPKSEWQARIEEIKERKSSLRHLCKLALHPDGVTTGLPCKDQSQTNYCWINAPTYATEVIRVRQNQPLVTLSPASVGAQLTNYRNVGGWGKDALDGIRRLGLTPTNLWPANAIDNRYLTAASKAEALKYRIDEWTELAPRNLNQLVSMLLRRIPVAVGYNWWGHEVTATGLLWLDGTVALEIRNSWSMGWGDEGYGILQGNKMLPDDAVCPRTAIAA